MAQLIKIQELQTMLSIGRATAYKWVSEKKIPFVKLPGGDIRFDKEKIEKWLERRTINAHVAGVKI